MGVFADGAAAISGAGGGAQAVNSARGKMQAGLKIFIVINSVLLLKVNELSRRYNDSISIYNTIDFKNMQFKR